MALSPDDIERRTFAVAPEGYDVDEVRTFLFDVAAGLRAATRPALPRSSATPRADATRWPERAAAVRLPIDELPGSRDATSAGSAAIDASASTAAFPAAELAAALGAAAGAASDREGGPGIETPFEDGGATAGAPVPDPDARPRPETHPAMALAETTATGDAYAQLGVEVAELLRTAHDSAASLRSQAETAARERLHEAERDARIVLSKAERDAGLVHDEAKRVLTTAQEQANTIVADAEYTAREILASAAVHAEEHTRATTDRARRHADEVLRAERDALARLRAAQAGVSTAIDRIARSDNRPVVDIRREVGDLRFGISDGTARPGPAGPAGDGDAGEDSEAEPLARSIDGEAVPPDPSLALMRKAVGRAILAAAETAPAAEAGPADETAHADADATGVPALAAPEGAVPDVTAPPVGAASTEAPR